MTTPISAPISDPALGQVRELLLEAEKIIRGGWTDPMSGAGAFHAAGFDGSDGLAITALDRVAQIGLSAIIGERHAILDAVVDTLASVFKYAGSSQLGLGERTPAALERADRWKAIILRVYALGAVALSYRNSVAIRSLVVRQPLEHHGGRFWIRDTVTALARGEVFAPKSLVPPAATYLIDHSQFFACLREDKERATDTLCQFDFLQCVIATHVGGDVSNCYPNFGIYYNERTEPIIVSLVRGEWARNVFDPPIGDLALANLLRTLDAATAHAFFDYNGWSAGAWTSNDVVNFLSAHRSKA